MEATRVRWFSVEVRKVPARESPGRPPPEFAAVKTARIADRRLLREKFPLIPTEGREQLPPARANL
jgi:hypothetical protein